MTGIFTKNTTGTGILEKFLVGNGIVTPPPPLHDPLSTLFQLIQRQKSIGL